MLLEQFDPTKQAVINPDLIHHPIEGFPDTIVSVFSHVLFGNLLQLLGGEIISYYHDVDGEFPVYRVLYNNHTFAFVKARLGAPACVGSFEDVLAMGGKRIILLGNCGVLDKTIGDMGIIIPTRALRDEGTGFHYAPPADDIAVNHRYIDMFVNILHQYGYPHVLGTVWTTDAFYRETPARVAARKAMGAICVDMECSAMQAMCDWRGIEFFQYFYAGDNLDHAQWQPRSLSGNKHVDAKTRIALLAFELASAIEAAAQ